MNGNNTARFARAAMGLVLAACALAPVRAVPSEQHQVVDHIAIYLGVLPAEMILGLHGDHIEETMHGGVPTGGHRYHVVVALFESVSGRRVTDAQVTAQVSELGLAGPGKRLERMVIGDTISYGNYFKMPGKALYRIELQIRRPAAAPVAAVFEYQHPL